MNAIDEKVLQDASAAGDPSLAYILFRCGLSWYGVPIRYVAAALTHTPLVRVPGTSDGVVGIAHFQGKIITVIDIRPCFGLHDPIDYNANHALLVVRHGHEDIGILADEIGEAVSIAEKELQPVVDVLGGSRRFMIAVARTKIEGQIARGADKSDATIVVIDLQAILNELCSKR